MVVGIPDATVMLPSSSNLSTTISTTINCPQQYHQNNTSPASKPLSVFAPGAVLKGIWTGSKEGFDNSTWSYLSVLLLLCSLSGFSASLPLPLQFFLVCTWLQLWLTEGSAAWHCSCRAWWSIIRAMMLIANSPPPPPALLHHIYTGFLGFSFPHVFARSFWSNCLSLQIWEGSDEKNSSRWAWESQWCLAWWCFSSFLSFECALCMSWWGFCKNEREATGGVVDAGFIIISLLAWATRSLLVEESDSNVEMPWSIWSLKN